MRAVRFTAILLLGSLAGLAGQPALAAIAGTGNQLVFTDTAPTYTLTRWNDQSDPLQGTYDTGFRIDGEESEVLGGVAAIAAELGLDIPNSVLKVYDSDPSTSKVNFFAGLTDTPVSNPDNAATRYLSFEIKSSVQIDSNKVLYYAMKSGQKFSLWTYDAIDDGRRNAAFVDTLHAPEDPLTEGARLLSFSEINDIYEDYTGSGDPEWVYGRDPSNLQFFLFTKDTAAVPEPATLAIWSIFGAGAAGVAAARRRRRGHWSDSERRAIYGAIKQS